MVLAGVPAEVPAAARKGPPEEVPEVAVVAGTDKGADQRHSTDGGGCAAVTGPAVVLRRWCWWHGAGAVVL